MALAAYADHLLIVAEPTLESVVSLTNRANLLRGLSSVHVVLTAGEPYSAHDVTIASRLPVWGVMPRADGRRGEAARETQLKKLIRDMADPYAPRQQASLASLLDAVLEETE